MYKTPPKEVTEYLATLTPVMQTCMHSIRQTILEAAPEAEEVFSYQMPGFKCHGALIWYFVFKNHYSIFMPPALLAPFEAELSVFGRSKSAIQFPLDYPAPLELITRLVQHGVAENLKKAQSKVKSKK